MALDDERARTDARLFEEVYQRYRHEVYRWSLRLVRGQAALAEDITHDVFVRLIGKLPSLDASKDLGGWLYRVTANLSLTRLRRSRSFAQRLEHFFFTDEEDTPPPSEEKELSDGAAQALAALRGLPPKESVVLTMKVLDGKSQKEIAEALGLSEGYVSKLVARAWKRLELDGWEVPDVQA